MIGVLSSASSGDYAAGLAAFHGGLRESGYVDGQNVKLEYVYADEQYDRLPELAANLARRQVSVIIAVATPGRAGAEIRGHDDSDRICDQR